MRKLVNGVTIEEYDWLDRIRLNAAIVNGLPMHFHYEQGLRTAPSASIDKGAGMTMSTGIAWMIR